MSINHTFECDKRAEQVRFLTKEILGDGFVSINVVGIKFLENFETNQAQLDAKVVEISFAKPKKKAIHGEGVGLVDACFDAMIKCYESEYCSLDTISIVEFTLSSNVERASKRKSDAHVTGVLRITNSANYEYTFLCTTPSISHSSIAVVQEAVAFFINAELAYTRMYYALKDAKDRGRHDLIDRYQNHMATLVHATSYEKLVSVLEKRRE